MFKFNELFKKKILPSISTINGLSYRKHFTTFISWINQICFRKLGFCQCNIPKLISKSWKESELGADFEYNDLKLQIWFGRLFFFFLKNHALENQQDNENLLESDVFWQNFHLNWRKWNGLQGNSSKSLTIYMSLYYFYIRIKIKWNQNDQNVQLYKVKNSSKQ